MDEYDERGHPSRRNIVKSISGAGIASGLGFLNFGTGVANASIGDESAHEIPPAERVAGNPLTGFVPFGGTDMDWDGDFPHSLEYFSLPLDALQVGYDSFDWSTLEAELEAIASRGNQAEMRMWLTIPGRETGVPEFLIDDGLSFNQFSEFGGGRSPNYHNQNLQLALKKFIEAFGERYDDDPRIAFVTEGLLGFWGEWHTYPHTDWLFPEIYNLVMGAFDRSFPQTMCLGREPYANASQYDLGYHDDSFCYSTLPPTSWHFVPTLQRAGELDKWKSAAFGGELRPGVQSDIFDGEKPWDGGGAQPWEKCVDYVHPTWMLNEHIKQYSGDTKQNAIKASKDLGYQLQAKTAYFSDVISLPQNDPLSIRLSVENIGYAPLYYNWDVLIGMLQDGSEIESWATGWDFTTIPATRGNGAQGGVRTFEFGIPHHDLTPGTFVSQQKRTRSIQEYSLAVKVVNPLPSGKSVRFANKGQRDDGWLDIGTVTIDFPFGDGNGGDDSD